ncbi:MAG: carboxypeptidase regulatory-like domain-containing protein [Myxococcales bacterium]|nr:carboxypeptidase regulatory-like domain-containing protein [Myxococcales bacterium]
MKLTSRIRQQASPALLPPKPAGVDPGRAERVQRVAWLGFASLLAIGLFGAACSSEDAGVDYPTGPTMRPGENCLACHEVGFGDPAPTWSAGGTIYGSKSAAADQGVKGVVVTITDVNGRTESAKTNRVGNFYFEEGLEPPYTVSIEYEGEILEMPLEAPAGSCNACHSWPDPIADAPGRIFTPQGRGDWVPMDWDAGDGGDGSSGFGDDAGMDAGLTDDAG